MSIADPLPESVEDIGNPNLQARRRQNMRWLLLIGGAAIVGGCVFYAMNFRTPAASVAGQQKALEQRTLATADAAAPATISPEAQNTKLRGQMADLQQELQTAQQQNAQLATQNADLGQQVTARADVRGPAPVRMRTDPSFDQAGQDVRATGGAAPIPRAQGAASPILDGQGAQTAAPARRSIRVIDFATAPEAPTAEASKKQDVATVDKISVQDSSQYVAPNSYVMAKVLVGVDMQTGMAATADPKPVLFRIAGAATGVGSDGKFQTSNLDGCLVNGAAFAELSSEKVYIKLQQITCPVDATHYLVSKLEGYVTYMGKSGVRGRVVSREGNFANKAFVAGTLQGLGQAMSTNTQRNLEGITSNNGVAGLATAPLTGSQIAQSTLGTGVSNASAMLADYYIKRAEQYQPVIEMPTGMDVELVFLAGFRFTNKGTNQ